MGQRSLLKVTQVHLPQEICVSRTSEVVSFPGCVNLPGQVLKHDHPLVFNRNRTSAPSSLFIVLGVCAPPCPGSQTLKAAPWDQPLLFAACPWQWILPVIMEQKERLHLAPKFSRMKDDGKSSQCRPELLQGDASSCIAWRSGDFPPTQTGTTSKPLPVAKP